MVLPTHRSKPLTPQQLKALAHPLRLQLVELLISKGPATASGLGRAVGESSGTTSYHLRQLAKAGMIEEDAERGSARDRWWRSGGGWSLEDDLMTAPESREEVDLVLGEVNRQRAQRVQRFNADRRRWPREWREASMLSTSQMVLTVEEAARMSEELLEVTSRYDRLHDRDDPPADTVRVVVQTDVFPTGEPPVPERADGSPDEG